MEYLLSLLQLPESVPPTPSDEGEKSSQQELQDPPKTHVSRQTKVKHHLATLPPHMQSTTIRYGLCLFLLHVALITPTD